MVTSCALADQVLLEMRDRESLMSKEKNGADCEFLRGKKFANVGIRTQVGSSHANLTSRSHRWFQVRS